MQAQSRSLKRLPLQRDLGAAEWQRLDAAAAACGSVFTSRGYSRIDTPLMEETELFLRKSGGELASRLYNFTDPGGYAVSLRPEFTAPVIRYVLEEAGLDDLPLRLQYAGPVFRYPSAETPAPDIPAKEEPGTFTQAGAELIGGPAPEGDAEIIEMALQGLVEIGIERPTVTVGHVGLLRDLLRPFELSERARLFLVNSVGALAEGRRDEVREEAASLGLVPEATATGDSDGRRTGESSGSEFAETVLGFGLGTSAAGSTGVRSTQEIVARLAAKLGAADDPDSFERALDFLSELSAIKGAPVDALRQGREVAAKASDDGPVDALDEIVEAAVAQGVSEDAITIDLGLVHGIAYYTGVVFDLTANDRSVGGGGRYDGLVRALGGSRDVPALGFAYVLEAATEESAESEQLA